MRVERKSIDQIQPAPYNPRRDLQPGDPEYEKLRLSIERWGRVLPLVWNERTGNLVGGHQGLKILQAQGETEVDVSVVDLSEADEAALALALNRITGEWDEAKLEDVLRSLDGDGFDLSLTGFDADELTGMLSGAPKDGGLSRIHTNPPAMSWVLIGIPTVRYFEIAPAVESLTSMPDVIIETALNDAKDG